MYTHKIQHTCTDLYFIQYIFFQDLISIKCMEKFSFRNFNQKNKTSIFKYCDFDCQIQNKDAIFLKKRNIIISYQQLRYHDNLKISHTSWCFISMRYNIHFLSTKALSYCYLLKNMPYKKRGVITFRIAPPFLPLQNPLNFYLQRIPFPISFLFLFFIFSIFSTSSDITRYVGLYL